MIKIEICKSCEGIGKKEIRNDYGDYEDETCKNCKGTGRLEIQSYNFEFAYTEDLKVRKIRNDFNRVIIEAYRTIKDK